MKTSLVINTQQSPAWLRKEKPGPQKIATEQQEKKYKDTLPACKIPTSL